MRRPSRKDRIWPYCRTNTRLWTRGKKQLHRENGPAIERDDGSKWWYRNGEQIMFEQANRHVEKDAISIVMDDLMREICRLSDRVEELEKDRG